MDTPIYCIGLAEEPWKRNITQAQFDLMELNVKWITAFHGETLHLKPLLACEYHPDGKKTYMHANQLGHTLSFLTALRVGLTNGNSDFIILEDDVLFQPDFSRRWQSVWESMVDHCDVAQLEHFRADDKIWERVDQNISRCYYPFGNCATWWTEQAATLAIRAMRPICEPTDIALMRRVYPFLRHGVVTPALCTQKTAFGHWPSSIGAEHKPIS